MAGNTISPLITFILSTHYFASNSLAISPTDHKHVLFGTHTGAIASQRMISQRTVPPINAKSITDKYAFRSIRSVAHNSSLSPVKVNLTSTMNKMSPSKLREIQLATSYVNQLYTGDHVHITMSYVELKRESEEGYNFLATAVTTSQNSGMIIFETFSLEQLFVTAVHEILHVLGFNGLFISEGVYNGSRVYSINKNELLVTNEGHWNENAPLSVGYNNDIMMPLLKENTRVSLESLFLIDDVRDSWHSKACTSDDNCDDTYCVGTSSTLPGYCASNNRKPSKTRPHHITRAILYPLTSILLIAQASVYRHHGAVTHHRTGMSDLF